MPHVELEDYPQRLTKIWRQRDFKNLNPFLSLIGKNVEVYTTKNEQI